MQILSDESTILGIQLIHTNVVKIENVREHSKATVCLDCDCEKVTTLLVHEKANALLVGQIFEKADRVVQYDLESRRVLRVYKNLWLFRIFSSCRARQVCFFGGYFSGLAVIDSVSRRFLVRGVKSAVKKIDSLAVCCVDGESAARKILLVMAGQYHHVTESLTDVLDFSRLVKANREKLD